MDPQEPGPGFLGASGGTCPPGEYGPRGEPGTRAHVGSIQVEAALLLGLSTTHGAQKVLVWLPHSVSKQFKNALLWGRPGGSVSGASDLGSGRDS